MLYNQAGSNIQSSYLSTLSTGIIGIYQHTDLKINNFFKKKYINSIFNTKNIS